MNSNDKKVILVGAGLVGSLLSSYLTKHGYKVSIYERRGDMRKDAVSAGRSINLALSDRGWRGLEGAGIQEEVRNVAIPMAGRTMHGTDQSINYLPYGKEGQAIYSVSRGGLNIVLMNEAEKKGATIYFNERCTHVDLEKNIATFENTVTGKTSNVNADLILCTDGAFSAGRLNLMLTDRYNYSQHYLEHGYKELTIPAGPGGVHQLEKNSLHIWPRGGYMLIALPNMDGSFTCTLFFPFKGEHSFEKLDTKEKVSAFFNEIFPDAAKLMPTLEEDFFHNPTGSLVTVKCFPWSWKNKLMLIGDAAHAIVPFYGQGMNCGFEDCSVLEKLMIKHNHDWTKIIPEFELVRKPDTDAIAELALANFIEMRDLVGHPDFLLRKKIEAWFNQKHPGKWTPLYTMVTFSDLSYHVALQRGLLQERIMDEIMETPGIENSWNTPEVEARILAKLS